MTASGTFPGRFFSFAATVYSLGYVPSLKNPQKVKIVSKFGYLCTI